MAHFVIFNSVAYDRGKLRLVVIERIRSLGMTYSEGNNSTVDLDLKLRPDFIFTGSLDDDAKWEAYGRANLFVLPTYSENFSIVVAEALWAGVPVITTKGTPWRELVGVPSSSGGKESDDHSPTPTQDSNSLKKMGANGHAFIERKYTWKAVVGAMKHGYEQILNSCELAPCDTCHNYGDTCAIK